MKKRSLLTLAVLIQVIAFSSFGYTVNYGDIAGSWKWKGNDIITILSAPGDSGYDFLIRKKNTLKPYRTGKITVENSIITLTETIDGAATTESYEATVVSDFEKYRLARLPEKKPPQITMTKISDRPLVRYYANEASKLNKKKQFEMASKAAQNALTIDRSSIEALLEAARALTGLELYYDAVNYYERILEINPKNKTARKEYEKIRDKAPMP